MSSAVSLPVRWTRGTDRPRMQVPANSTDCHHHIYDARCAWAPEATSKPGDASVDDYRGLQARIGTDRNVIVQPSSYGTDNSVLLAALGRLGDSARGVAVVDASVTDEQLDELDRGGVRGVRFNLSPPGTTTLAMVEPLACRVARLGWHVQVNAPADKLLEARATWVDLPCPIVFDHLAQVPEPRPLEHPAFALVVELLQAGRAYVKLSGFYGLTRSGAPTYADRVALARAFATAAPDRVLWGSDWPHPTEQPDRIPDDAVLLDLLADAVPDDAPRRRVLVDNPNALYRFA